MLLRSSRKNDTDVRGLTIIWLGLFFLAEFIVKFSRDDPESRSKPPSHTATPGTFFIANEPSLSEDVFSSELL